MTPVFVAADDFGLCPEINAAICRLHDCGVVGRTSLVVNTESFDASVAALRGRPALEIAIHLNLTDGRPVLPPEEVPTLVDEHGCFPGGRHFGIVGRIVSGRTSRREIHCEWRAQIAKARRAGVVVQELNSHGHLHLLPQLHGVGLALRREFDIPRVRLVRSFEWPRGLLLHLCSLRLRRKLQRDGVAVSWPDRTLGLRTPGAVDQRISLGDLARRRTTSEVIVHPSHGANDFHTRWGYAGDAVMRWLLRDVPQP